MHGSTLLQRPTGLRLQRQARRRSAAAPPVRAVAAPELAASRKKERWLDQPLKHCVEAQQFNQESLDYIFKVARQMEDIRPGSPDAMQLQVRARRAAGGGKRGRRGPGGQVARGAATASVGVYAWACRAVQANEKGFHKTIPNVRARAPLWLAASQGAVMSTLFYEPSTRTRLSFESAMAKLGGTVLSTESAGEYSSAAKGETLEGEACCVCCFAGAQLACSLCRLPQGPRTHLRPRALLFPPLSRHHPNCGGVCRLHRAAPLPGGGG